VADEEEKEK
jgi:hypothetical protein